MATVSTTIKLDKDLKNEAQKFFDQYGLSLSAAVTMLLLQTVQEWAIPFSVGEPIQDDRKPLTFEEVVAALEEANAEAEKPGYEETLIDHDTFIRQMRRVANGIQD